MTGEELDRQVEKYLEEHHHAGWKAWAIVGGIMAIIVGVGIWAFLYVDSNQDAGKARGQARELRIAALETNYSDLYEWAERCKNQQPGAVGCIEPPTPEPKDIAPKVTVQEGDTTIIRQIETLPPSAVRAAVTNACGGSCKGKDVTAAMIRDAIIENCGGSCKGDDGESIKGDKGDPAEPPTEAQILAAVSQYCAESGNCKGDPGPICPEGYTAGVLEVLTSLASSTELFACIANESP